MLKSKRCVGTVAIMSGVPAVLTDFCWSFAQLVQFNTEHLESKDRFIHYDRATMSDHAPARNKLVADMKGDWLLQLDTDHAFSPDLLFRLLDRMVRAKLDVVTGLYRFKSAPSTPVLYVWDDGRLRPIGKTPRMPIFEVGAAGAGCLLVRRRVFDRIWRELKEPPFDRIHPHSEDISFFVRLKKLGIKAYCDQRVEVPHLRAVGVGPTEVPDGELDDRPIAVGGMAERRNIS